MFCFFFFFFFLVEVEVEDEKTNSKIDLHVDSLSAITPKLSPLSKPSHLVYGFQRSHCTQQGRFSSPRGPADKGDGAVDRRCRRVAITSIRKSPSRFQREADVFEDRRSSGSRREVAHDEHGASGA